MPQLVHIFATHAPIPTFEDALEHSYVVRFSFRDVISPPPPSGKKCINHSLLLSIALFDPINYVSVAAKLEFYGLDPTL